MGDMNWDAIGAIGELVGALAVIVTLVYLSVQIRGSREAVADSNRQSRAGAIQDMILLLIDNDSVNNAWRKAAANEDYTRAELDTAEHLGLSIEETRKVILLCQFWWWTHWAQWASIHSAEDQRELDDLIRTMYNREPIRTVWTQSQSARTLDAEFQTYVNGLIEGNN